jgi:hypothetical protein
MWPGITPAMKKMVLRIQSMPGPATINTDMGGPRLLVGVGGKRVGGGRGTEYVDRKDYHSLHHNSEHFERVLECTWHSNDL